MALDAPPLAWFCAATWPRFTPPLTDAFAIIWDRSELHGLNVSGRSPGGLDARALRGTRRDAGTQLGLGHRVRRRRRLGRAVGPVRQTTLRQKLWACGADVLQDQLGFAEHFMPGG
jgi:gamma-glutamyltranspeptidase/glutathione hydrolase